jgi:tetratricopeptide (TPR) repeat protein
MIRKGLKSGVIVCFFFHLWGCSSESERFVRKADAEAIKQNSQLSKYLYGQVIEKHKAKDDVRYRALRGLAEVSMSQLFDYRTALKAMEVIFDEYGAVSAYELDIRNLRLKAARIFRQNLDQAEKSLDVLSPLIVASHQTLEELREIANTYLSIGDYEQARDWFSKAWTISVDRNHCDSLKSLQLDMMQVYSLRDMCDEVLKWSSVSFPKDCVPDELSIAVERAHCLEILGEINKAIEIYEELIRQQPKNARAHFFLENLKRRQKERQSQ